VTCGSSLRRLNSTRSAREAKTTTRQVQTAQLGERDHRYLTLVRPSAPASPFVRAWWRAIASELRCTHARPSRTSRTDTSSRSRSTAVLVGHLGIARERQRDTARWSARRVRPRIPRAGAPGRRAGPASPTSAVEMVWCGAREAGDDNPRQAQRG
jgi:hypothetical protein